MSSPTVHLRQSIRSLLRSPGFSLAVVATLALAIGPGVLLLSMAEQIFLRPLPVRAPERLVVFQPPEGPFSGSSSVWSDFSVTTSYPEYRAFAGWSDGPFEGVAARAPVSLAIAWEGHSEEVTGEIVSGNYFDVLGLAAERGRLLAPSDDVTVGGHPVVVLSWSAWQRRFGGEGSVVGRSIDVNGQAMTVVGVAPRGFRSLEVEFAPELWIPMAMKPVATPLRNDLDNWRSRWLNIFARLEPGIDLERAEELANQMYRRTSEESVALFTGFDEVVRQRYLDRHLALLPGGRGRSDLRGDAGRALFAVLGLVGLLLALACANLANLFAARATRHERELTVRLALGASRGDLVRRVLTEALLLSATAAAAGLALVALLGRVLPARLADQPGALVPQPSLVLVGCAAALALVAALGAGLLPALATTRGGIAERLRATAGSALGGLRGARTRRVLVGVQVALSAPILIGAGLAVRSLDTLLRRDPGFQPAGVVMFRVDPRLTGLSLEAENELVDRLERELAGVPGVASIARSEVTLLENSMRTSSLEIEGRDPTESNISSRFDTVTPGFFETLGIPIRRGRGFTEADRAGSTPVAVVSERFVRDYFPGEDPIGKRFRWGGDDVESEIVGVAGDVLPGNLREDAPRFTWVPWAQAHDGSPTTFYVRSRGSGSKAAEALAPTLRRKVAEIAPGLPVVELRTLEAQARRSLRVERITASLASGLGLLAAALAAVGLYGVLAYAVDARRRELALRAALGAAPVALGRWVVAHAAAPVVAGLLLGVAAALGASGVLETLLFGVAPRDPATFAAVVAGLLAVSLVAALVPARRALAIQPATALREE